jgi:hypothetical protein
MKETTAAGSQSAPGVPQITGQVRRMDESRVAAAGSAAVQGTAGPAEGAPSPARGSHRSSSPPGWLVAGVPLAVVLVAQLLLSLRLARADTAFQDEAAYLWAGHLEWAHWLHGAAIPHFPAYFSGAPVIYPPIGALADAVGGLAAARELSLVFMLGATALLWATTSRLYGRRAAFFAAALFAVLGPTLHLGAFATYDAMAMFLVALAAWCVVRGGQQGTAGWLLAGGIALAVANATAYSSALFDLIVIGLAILMAFPAPAREALRRGLPLVATVAVACGAGLLIGGSAYFDGIERTTFLRAGGTNSPLTVLNQSMSWTGVIVVAAACAVAVSWLGEHRTAQTWLLALLACAALLGPIEQARLHTTASLNKHVDLGAWFAAIAAGYAADRFIAASGAGRPRTLACGACVLALAFPISVGVSQSRAFATSWPNSFSFTAILRPLAGHGGGRLLVEDPSIAEYYLPAGSQWQRWSSTRNIVLPGGASTGGPDAKAGVVGPGNPGVFDEFITNGYFSYVALNFADTAALDHGLATELHHNPNYHIIDVVPYGPHGTYVIWQYRRHR